MGVLSQVYQQVHPMSYAAMSDQLRSRQELVTLQWTIMLCTVCKRKHRFTTAARASWGGAPDQMSYYGGDVTKTVVHPPGGRKAALLRTRYADEPWQDQPRMDLPWSKP